MVSIHLTRLFLTGVSVTLRDSSCSDFGPTFMSEYISTKRRESVLTVLFQEYEEPVYSYSTLSR